MKIVYSPIAIRDLDRVWAEVYEVSSDFDIAEKYIDDIMDCISQKRAFPKSGSPLYYEGTFTGYYFVKFKAYLAFYRVKDECVYVERVVYAKSDYMRIIFKTMDI